MFVMFVHSHLFIVEKPICQKVSNHILSLHIGFFIAEKQEVQNKIYEQKEKE